MFKESNGGGLHEVERIEYGLLGGKGSIQGDYAN